MADYVNKSMLYSLCEPRGIVTLHVSDIDAMPSADVAPVVHARWELSQRIAGGARWECSLCGREIETNMLKKITQVPILPLWCKNGYEQGRRITVWINILK